MRIDHEFAFDLAAQDEAWLKTRLEKFGATRKDIVQTRALYLDTPDGAIAALGLALGLRRSRKMPAAGASRRAPAAPPQRWSRFIEEISPLPAPRARLDTQLRDMTTREALALVATRDSVETAYDAQFGDAFVDVRAERSTIGINGKTCVVATVTLRLVMGDLADFLRGIRSFADPTEMRLCDETALIRGRRLLRADRDVHVGAFAPRLGRAMDVSTAFQEIAGACFDQYLRNEAAVRELRDSEAVHQCRVALRRLRAALRLFRLQGDDETMAAWRVDLKHVLAQLGDARDIDVLLGEQVAPRLAPASTPGSQALLRNLEARRDQAYDKLVATLQSAQTKSFYLDLALWIAADQFGAPEIWSQTIVAFLHERFAKETRKLIARGEHVEQDSEHARHRTRIVAKNLRYGAEFFESLLVGKAARKRFSAFTGALKKIQEILGDRNDLVNARQFFAQLVEDARLQDAETQAAVTAVAQLFAQPAHTTPESEFLSKANDAFARLREAKPFWVKIEDGSED